MGFWTNFFLILAVFIFGGSMLGFIISQIIKARKKPKVDITTKVINSLSKWTNGHSEGWLVDQRKTPSGLTRVEFFPVDLSTKERLAEKVENEVIIAKHVKTIPRGVFSSNISYLWILPNTIDEFIKKFPFIEFELNLFKNDKELKTEIENLHNSFKENEEIKQPLVDFIEKLETTLKSKKNGKYDQLKAELTLLSTDIKNKLKDIETQKDSLDKIKNKIIKVSTKDLFDYSILSNDLMFTLGESTKKAYDSFKELQQSLNFGAMTALERKKLEERMESVEKYFLNKGREEKKID